MGRLLGLLCLLPAALASGPWEWAGTFDLQPDDYTWSFQKKNGAYADPSLQILVVATTDSTQASLEAVEESAETKWTTPAAVSVAASGTFSPGASCALQMDLGAATTLFTMSVATAGSYAVFLQHSPYEFEETSHYLKLDGNDVEPSVEEADGHDGHDHGGEGNRWEWAATFDLEAGEHYTWSYSRKSGSYADPEMNLLALKTADTTQASLETAEGSAARRLSHDGHDHGSDDSPDTSTDVEKEAESSGLWGEVLGASFITVLPTLIGLVFVAATLAPAIARMHEENSGWLAVVNSFASGVIFAAAVFLLLPEGLYLVAVGKTEAGGSGAWGTALMSGWVFCVIIKHVGQIVFGPSPNAVSTVEGGNAASDEEAAKPAQTSTAIDWTVCVPIIVGDGFHNFSDGLVIGTAFKTCTTSFGWKLTAITVLHELPQELADFAVLITKGRMPKMQALVMNFLSGCSTIIGAIITYSISVSPGVEGVILAAGGGVYLYVAMTELGSAVTELGDRGNRAMDAVKRLAGFTIGAILLGLILLDHEHCGGKDLLSYDPNAPQDEAEEGAEDDPHAGHNHAHR